VLFVLSLTPLLGSGEMVSVIVQGQEKLISRLAYFGYDILAFIVIFVPIWVVVRLIVNKGWSEKEERAINNFYETLNLEQPKKHKIK